MTDKTQNSATCVNESGMCLSSEKGCGTCETKKEFVIGGTVTISEYTNRHMSSGTRQCNDARWYSASEGIELCDFGADADGIADLLVVDGDKTLYGNGRYTTMPVEDNARPASVPVPEPYPEAASYGGYVPNTSF
jgi:hypothetical protein